MKRIISIQDISALGKCSLTVALQIISAIGIECAVVPTAVLSKHTQFKGWTFHDLTDEFMTHDSPEIRTVALEDLAVRTADIGIKDLYQALAFLTHRHRQILPIHRFLPVKIKSFHFRHSLYKIFIFA